MRHRANLPGRQRAASLPRRLPWCAQQIWSGAVYEWKMQQGARLSRAALSRVTLSTWPRDRAMPVRRYLTHAMMLDSTRLVSSGLGNCTSAHRPGRGQGKQARLPSPPLNRRSFVIGPRSLRRSACLRRARAAPDQGFHRMIDEHHYSHPRLNLTLLPGSGNGYPYDIHHVIRTHPWPSNATVICTDHVGRRARKWARGR